MQRRARTKRIKLERGIWKDAYGISVMVMVAGKTFEKRHPLGTRIAVLRQVWCDLKWPIVAPARTMCDRILEEISAWSWTANAGDFDQKARRGPPNKIRLRLTVIAATGLLPTTLGRVSRGDLDLAMRTVVVRDARTDPRTMCLTPAGVAAFRAFAKANAFGDAAAGYLTKAWRRAVVKAQATWESDRPGVPWPIPSDHRPFDLQRAVADAVAIAR